MTSDTLKFYKLIVLYFLCLAKQEITNAILSDFILSQGYTDYFSIQETLSSLAEDGMIRPHQTHTATYYTITERGREALQFFSSHLPGETKEEIRQYLTDKKIQILEETSVRADYNRISATEYLAQGTVLEFDNVLFEVSLSVPTEKKAIEICDRFKQCSDEIYGFLLKTLTDR